MEVIYYAPYAEHPCRECKWREYDTYHNEKFCIHKPPPKGLGKNCPIDSQGTCGYWEDYKKEI